MQRKRDWPKIIALAVALIFAIAGVDVIVDEDGGGDTTTIVQPPTQAPAEIKVDGADADRKADDTIKLDDEAQEQLEDTIDENIPAGELADPLVEPGDVQEPTEGPLAAQETPGCRTAFVRNQSSRNGVTPRVIVWHQTVSRENGTSSQNALTAYANSASSGVSWHYLIGRTQGRCTYSVPLTMKAWTQGNANPFSVGIEVEAYGDEGAYVVGDGKKKLLAVTRYIGKRYGIPMRRGAVSNCRVVRSGIVEHDDLGVCGGGHVDVTLSGVNGLIRAAARSGPTKKPNTKAERRACGSLAYHRTRVRRGAEWYDTITNRRGNRVRRSTHANAQKRILKRGKVSERRYCNGTR